MIDHFLSELTPSELHLVSGGAGGYGTINEEPPETEYQGKIDDGGGYLGSFGSP